MSESGSTITFPRKVIARGVVRTLGRLLLPVACRIRITGQENFPKGGPLLVVGNHTAAMEAVLMAVYTPWQVEMLDAVNALLPADDPARQAGIVDVRFELRVTVQGAGGEPVSYPTDLDIRHTAALAKLLHRPVVLKIFTENLRLPTRALQNLHDEHDAGVIADAARSILDYLSDENPYLLAYRFGLQEAGAMQAGLAELLALARWAAESGLALTITPVRRFYSLNQEREVVQIKQGSFERWM
jgi:hypothetical protein